MAGPENSEKKVLKFKLVGEGESKESPASRGDKVSFNIQQIHEASKTESRKVKLKILSKEVPPSLKSLEGAPGVTMRALHEIKDMLEDMNKYQKRIADLEVVEGELKVL